MHNLWALWGRRDIACKLCADLFKNHYKLVTWNESTSFHSSVTSYLIPRQPKLESPSDKQCLCIKSVCLRLWACNCFQAMSIAERMILSSPFPTYQPPPPPPLLMLLLLLHHVLREATPPFKGRFENNSLCNTPPCNHTHACHTPRVLQLPIHANI